MSVRTFCSYLTVCVLAVSLSASTVSAQPPSREYLKKWAKASLAKHYAWMNASWSDNDRAYAGARQEIDTLIKNGSNPADLMHNFEAEAKNDPSDPMAQFRYNYAGYQAVSHHRVGFEVGWSTIVKMPDICVKYAFPHTYNLVRLAYLCETYFFADPNLKNLATRLLAKDPNDNEVKYYAVEILGFSKNAAEIALALQYAVSLENEHWGEPGVYGLVGNAYYNEWMRSHNKADEDQALAAYQEYLNMAPKDSRYRGVITTMVDKIKSGK